MELDKIKNKLKNLKQNKNLTEEEIEKLAKEQIERESILSSLTFCLPEEKEFAINLLEKYLSESSLESAAEKDTLKQLVDLEVLLERIKKLLNTEYSKANPAIPVQFLQQVSEINNQIIEIKDKLGLTKKENTNTLDEWNKLKAKALAYYKENQGCNVAKCPYCQKLFMILKDLRGHTLEKLPIFKRSIIYNKELYELYEKGIITKEKLASIFGVNSDYIDYIFENIYQNDK